MFGWSGNLSTNYIRRSENGYSNNATLNYQNNRFQSSLKLRQYNNRKRSSEINSIAALNSMSSDDRRLDMNDGIGANLSVDYRLSEKSRLGLIYDFENGHKNMDIINSSVYATQSVIDSILSTFAEHRQNGQMHTLSTYYDFMIDTLGEKLSVGLNYFSNNPRNQIDFTTKNSTIDTRNSYRSLNVTNYNVWSGQVDLTLPYQWGTIETGLKSSYFKNESELVYSKIENNHATNMTEGLNVFNYKESNYALYLSVDKNISERWSAKAGLRYEHSLIKGTSPLSGDQNIDNYGRFFPTAFLVYRPDQNKSLSVSYSRRITRPFFRALNPNRWYTNPYTFSKGNPLLKPSFNDNLDLSFSLNGKLNMSVYFQKASDIYTQLVSFSDGIKVIDYANIYNQNSTGLDISYYDELFKGWDVGWTVNAYYANSESISDEIVGQESFNFSYDINNTFFVNESRTFQFYLNYSQMLPSTFGNYKSEGYSILNIGSKISLLGKRLQANIFFEDVFKTTVSKGEAIYTDFTVTNRNYYDTRSFNISLSYLFGQNKNRSNNKSINFDEKGRAK